MVDYTQLVEATRAQKARDEIAKADDSRMATAMLAAVLMPTAYPPYEGSMPPPDHAQQRIKLAVDYAEMLLAEVQRRRVPAP